MESGDLGIWMLVVLAGAIGQMVDGVAGMGFGVLSSTIMIAVGVDPVIAVSTVNITKLGSGVISGLSHWRFGNTRPGWVLLLAAPGVVGGIVGALLLSSLTTYTARILISLILVTMGVIVFRRFWQRKGSALATPKERVEPVTSAIQPGEASAPAPFKLPKRLRIGGVGLLAGVVNGFSGAYGPLATSLMLLMGKSHPRYAVGSVNVAEFFVAAAVAGTLIARMDDTTFAWKLPLALIFGSLLTGPLAAYLSRRLHARPMGLAIGVTLVALNLWAFLAAVA
jgi:uncharacterized membrane protein YfcA